MLEYLNENSGAFNVLFSAVVALSTFIYAVLTIILVKETRRMRLTQTEPKLEVVAKSKEEWINLINVYIKNIGLGPAHNISFEISPEKGGIGAQALIDDFTKAKFFRTGIK